MTELSKEKIAEIAYKAIKKWFDTNVSSTLKQKNINVINACLALYQYFIAWFPNMARLYQRRR